MLCERLPEKIATRLRLPLIVAPMLSVSGPDLAIAASKAGVVGSFPLAHARTIEGVDCSLNPVAFVRATREMFDGSIVIAGGISDGAAVWASQVLGCDLAYMGTKFIATHESMAPDAYKQMLVDSDMDDVMLTQAFTGLDTNMLKPSMIAAGLDPATLPPRVSIEEAARNFGSKGIASARRYKDIWSAGH